MKFYQNNDKFTVAQTPTGVWAIGGIFIAAALIGLYILFGGASNYSKIPFLYLMMGRFVCLGVLLGGCRFIYRKPKFTAKFDRTLQRIIVQKFRLFKTETEEYSFGDISAIITAERIYHLDARSTRVENISQNNVALMTKTEIGYDVALVLKNNEKVYLTASYEDKKRAMYDYIVERLNEFIGR
jgi:hypothetical protein